MTPDLANALNQLFVAVLGLAVVSVVYFLRQGVKAATAYLTAKIGAQNADTVKGLARTIVRFLAQSPAFKNIDSTEKFERAAVWLDQETEKVGIKLDEDKLAKYIEEAYLDLKNEAGPILTGEGNTTEPTG